MRRRQTFASRNLQSTDPALAQLLRARHYLDLLDLDDAAFPDMIRGPARLACLDVSEVLQPLLTELKQKPGSLPLMASALAELWRRREGNKLTRKALRGKEHGIFDLSGNVWEWCLCNHDRSQGFRAGTSVNQFGDAQMLHGDEHGLPSYRIK